MDEHFSPEEKLYRAVYPAELVSMFWRKDGSLLSAAFADTKGLSVDRGYFRKSQTVIDPMRKRFSGVIASVCVKDCSEVKAVVCFLPSKNNPYHSEIHGSETELLLSKSQRIYLSRKAVIEG